MNRHCFGLHADMSLRREGSKMWMLVPGFLRGAARRQALSAPDSTPTKEENSPLRTS